MTANMGIKYTPKQINSLQEMYDLNVKLLLYKSFSSNDLSIYGKVIENMYRNSRNNSYSMIPHHKMINEFEWLNAINNRMLAFYGYEVSNKAIVNGFMRKYRLNCAFRYLDEEIDTINMKALAWTTRLDRVFSDKLYAR